MMESRYAKSELKRDRYMTVKKALTAITAASLAFAGTASASAAGENIARQAAPVSQSEELEGSSAIGWIIGALVAAGVAYVIIDDDDDDDDAPVSP